MPESTQPIDATQLPAHLSGRIDRMGRTVRANRREPRDAILRHWVMLQLIPREPGGISAQQLRGKLAAIDPLYEVHKRTIERNLMQLTSVFPGLDHNDHPPRGLRWFWRKDTILDIPRLDARTALMFRLAETFLAPMFPRTLLDELRPYFRQAQQALREFDEHGYARWPEKVQVISNAMRLRPPAIRPEVLEIVHAALLKEQRFHLDYQRRDGVQRQYEVSPRGLVFRDGFVYCVCTLSDRIGLRQLPLHRMRAARLLDHPVAPLPGFNLKQYARAAFDYPLHTLQAHFAGQDPLPPTLPLHIALDPSSAVLLREAPLSDDQTLADLPDGRVDIRATVANTGRLRGWLLSYGDRLEVLGPPALREEIAATLERLYRRYRPAVEAPPSP